VPVVQTLHNYRPLCVNGLFLRNGKTCEKCIGLRVPWPGVVYRCYRDSLGSSAAMALMQLSQRVFGTWWKDVDLFMAPSEFLRQKYVAAGFPGDRITVKPHFAKLEPQTYDGDRRYALFVGRLSSEKGVHTLIAAWKRLPHIPLIILGDGPRAQELRTEARELNNITFAGAVSRQDVLGYLQHAKYLVLPSECYETFSMVMLEAFACSTPVIGSRLGAIPEFLCEGRNGLLFTPGDSADLATRASYLWSRPDVASELGRRARQDHEARFTPERNYRELLTAYDLASRFHARGAQTPAHKTQNDALPQPR
jgi:glycosyltransferase involved in cell wall biosynthesis